MASKPGFWNGKHFTDYVDDVKGLKRDGRLTEAIELLGHLVSATEAEDAAKKWGVAPWYYEQLAIIYRKVGKPEAELAILERYAQHRHAPGVKPPVLLARLEKIRSKQSH